ncbi:MAG: RdgB/HAM1 family non-canonical purine NTP pyrophosphatase [Steroidobacteraceae bacterium]
MRVVLATANPGKQREFATLLAPRGFELVLQSELGIDSVEETGNTFEDNALLKARHAAALAKLPALADDSGLEVDALGGRPGVWSARFAGVGATDAENNARLIEELSGVPDDQRVARYRCVLALVRSDVDIHPILAQGAWEGRIGHEAKGNGGFGYDPWFIPAGLECTAAELSPARKNALSHRGAALRDLIARLGTWT